MDFYEKNVLVTKKYGLVQTLFHGITHFLFDFVVGMSMDAVATQLEMF